MIASRDRMPVNSIVEQKCTKIIDNYVGNKENDFKSRHK